MAGVRWYGAVHASLLSIAIFFLITYCIVLEIAKQLSETKLENFILVLKHQLFPLYPDPQ
jgi:hypothetical protein